MAIVKKICGNRMTEIVMDNYFNPQSEEIRQSLSEHMPSLLVGASDSSTKLDRKRVRQKLREMTESSWAQIRDALLADLGPADSTAA